MGSTRKWLLAGAMCLGGFGMMMMAAGCGYDHHHEDWVDDHGYHHIGYHDQGGAWHGGYDDEHGVHHDDPGDWHR